MIMSDTCATHRSRVPRRSSGRIKGGVTTVEEERGPGLDFNLCFVCGSRPWGAAALLLCLLICLLNFFKCSPVPASFFPIYELCYNQLHHQSNVQRASITNESPTVVRQRSNLCPLPNFSNSQTHHDRLQDNPYAREVHLETQSGPQVPSISFGEQAERDQLPTFQDKQSPEGKIDYVYMDINTLILIQLRQYSD